MGNFILKRSGKHLKKFVLSREVQYVLENISEYFLSQPN